MSCERWDVEVALWAGGDAVSGEFLDHVVHCGRCRDEVAAMRQAMGEWNDWRVPAAPRVRPWRWAAAAAAALAAIGLGLRPEPGGIAPPAPPAPPPAVEIAWRAPPPAPPVRALRREAPRPRAATVKILTDDPSVVILLVGDSEE